MAIAANKTNGNIKGTNTVKQEKEILGVCPRSVGRAQCLVNKEDSWVHLPKVEEMGRAHTPENK